MLEDKDRIFKNLYNDFKTDINSAVNNGDWKDIKELRLDDAETLRPPKGSELKVRKIGGRWTGNPPEFRFLRWL